MYRSFSRRMFLQSAVIATAGMALPLTFQAGQAAQTMEPSPRPRNPGYYRFKLGAFELVSVSDGVLSVPAAAFAGNATPEQIELALQEGFQLPTLTPDCNVLYVNTGQNRVLIDTGSGSLNGSTAGKLLENLQVAQINPAEVDTIIITHAHGDHIGGLLDASGNPAFANARLYISKIEHDFWTQPEVSLPKSGLDAESVRGVVRIIQQQFAAIQPRLTLFEANRDIVPGISTLLAPGHTPGQVAVRITAGNLSLTHTADVVHTHTLNLWHPDWKPIFDADPDQAALTRQQVLSQIAADRQLMYAYHFPFPGLGHIRPRTTGGFLWEPINWQFEV